MFFVVCLSATVILSIYSINRYLINEDATLVKVTKFLSSRDAIYPSFSLCMLQPFLEKKFKLYRDAKINMTSYIDFLKGEVWDERFLKVDYDRVTASLSDNLIASGYLPNSIRDNEWKADHYVSFRASNRKCFTINAPFQNMGHLWWYWVKVKTDIFPHGERLSANKIKTYLHYPGQRLTSYYTIKYDFKSRQNLNVNYEMEYRVRNIDVITRRNKRHASCVEDWRHYDQHFMEFKMNEIGCRPPHWNTTSDLPTCHDAIRMKSFSKQPKTFEIESFDPPCRVINRLDYIYEEKNLSYNR